MPARLPSQSGFAKSIGTDSAANAQELISPSIAAARVLIRRFMLRLQKLSSLSLSRQSNLWTGGLHGSSLLRLMGCDMLAASAWHRQADATQ
jgi:hypothetical protein